MVKVESLKKSELIELLQTSSTSKERNRACKLLKKFEPNPKRDLDDQGEPKNMKAKQYQMLQSFVCYRCDKVKQTNIKVTWSTSQGVKSICHTCYANLCAMKELEETRRSRHAPTGVGKTSGRPARIQTGW